MHDFGETELNSRNTAKPVKQEITSNPVNQTAKPFSRSERMVVRPALNICVCSLVFTFFVGDNGVCRSNEWLFCPYF